MELKAIEQLHNYYTVATVDIHVAESGNAAIGKSYMQHAIQNSHKTTLLCEC